MLAFALVAATLVDGCSSAPKGPGFVSSKPGGGSSPVVAPKFPGGKPGKSSPKLEAEYADAQTAYSSGDFETATRKVEALLAKSPRGAVYAQAQNLYGLCHLLHRKYPEAIQAFQAAVATDPNNRNFNLYVLYNLAKAQVEAGRLGDAESTLTLIDPSALDRENRSKFHFLRGTVHVKRGIQYEGLREILTASRLLEGIQLKDVRNPFGSLMAQAIDELPGTLPLENLYSDFEDSPFADYLLLRLAQREQAAGEHAKAELHLQTLMSRFPQSEHYAQAAQLSRARESEIPVDGTAIGVLLPMKGKYGRFGARVLQAVELGFNIWDNTAADTRTTIVVEDSGEEPETAVRALERLVQKHHVAAVIGPLLTKGIDQVTARAQELKVPLLSLSRQPGTPPADFAVAAGLTQHIQAFELARHGIQQLGLKRFAIMAPRDKFGEEFTHAFWDAVEQMGGEIVGVESYNPGETDFRAAVDRLSGLYYTEARQRELDVLAKDRETNQIRKRTRKTEQFFALKPIVDFDAVIVPDEPKVAGQVLPTFGYRDVEGIKFLGTSAWNSPEFTTRTQGFGERSFFVEAFLPASNSAQVKRFTDNYRLLFNQEPTSTEAIAYDAARLLDQALIQSGAERKRGDILERLKSTKGFPGVTGTIAFKDGYFFRDLKLLTLKGNQIVEASSIR